MSDTTHREARARNVSALAARGVRLPTFAELADPCHDGGHPRTPGRMGPRAGAALADVDPDAADPRNLFRVHWYNDASRRGLSPVPGHVVLPESLTGVRAPIVVLLGDRFPLIRAHKVLAAYACLVPRLVRGAFDVERHRAAWPSTGNYCRGGVAISRILGARAAAILPAEMSEERFRWLAAWVSHPDDIVRTPGSESNIKEVYDRCARLAADPANVVLNQFSEYPNHVVHHAVTGAALARVFDHLQRADPRLSAAAFVSATGSAGTIAAGDALKERHGTRIVAAEALECPTLLRNGYGSHHVQGIGDRHVPLIHNVMNTDVVAAVSDAATDGLWLLANDEAGLRFLREARGVPEDVLGALRHFGLSSWCNVLAAAKTARALGLGEGDVILTIATDGAEMYESERGRILASRYGGRFDAAAAAGAFGRWVLGLGTDAILELRREDRERIFNLGYYTWVEQQGASLADFDARRDQAFWRATRARIAQWDEEIVAFDRDLGSAGAGRAT